MTIFEQKDHLRVYISVRSTAGFHLGFGILGTSKLGADGGTNGLVDFNADCSSINITKGQSMNGIDAQRDQTQCIITLTGTSDPLAGYLTPIGGDVTIQVNDSGSTWVSLFTGRVASVDKTVDSDGSWVVNVIAGDRVQEYLSTYVSALTAGSIVTGKSTFVERMEAYRTVINALPSGYFDITKAYPPVGAPASFVMTDLDLFETTISDSFAATLAADAAWLIQDNYGAIYPICHGYFKDQLVNGTPVITLGDSWTNAHVGVDNIQLSSDLSIMPNTYEATLSWDSTTVINDTDQDMIDLYGSIAESVSLDLFDAIELQKYVDYAFSVNGPKLVKSVSLDAIDHRNRKLSDIHTVEVADLVVFDINANNLVITDRYFVTGLNHQITPNSWETTLELWRP